jgi:hypothetical protein
MVFSLQDVRKQIFNLFFNTVMRDERKSTSYPTTADPQEFVWQTRIKKGRGCKAIQYGILHPLSIKTEQS